MTQIRHNADTPEDTFVLTVEVTGSVDLNSAYQGAQEGRSAATVALDGGDGEEVERALEAIVAMLNGSPAVEAPDGGTPARPVPPDLVKDSAGMTYWDHWAESRDQFEVKAQMPHHDDSPC